MPAAPLFLFESESQQKRALALLRRMPPLTGDAILIQSARGLRDRYGAAHAGACLRARRILFDCTRAEFPRIFVHEVAHFIWGRLGNPLRWNYEDLLRREFEARALGELGWSAEWRKAALRGVDVTRRSRRWREYCCESFCDTAAWLYSGVARHPEFTLSGRFHRRRRRWFAQMLASRRLSL